jgi:5'-3' exonuclease
MNLIIHITIIIINIYNDILQIKNGTSPIFVINYLEGLEWTMKYYTIGCSDWRWCYNYNYPPLFCDLINYIPYFDTEFIGNKKPSPVTDLVQLCYVLPKQSLHFLPDNIHKKLIQEHSEWYKSNCDFVWSYCSYFWEAHVDLPYIDINELEEFIKKCVV